MKKNLGFLAIALTLFVSVAQAGTVSFEGEVNSIEGVITDATDAGGTINLVFDLNAADNFKNGGVSLSVAHDNPGLIQFNSAQVHNPGGRWTVASAVVSAGGSSVVDFNVFSVNSEAFPTGGQDELLATISYTFVDATTSGVANLAWITNEESLVDGRDFGTIVTQDYTFIANSIQRSLVPEPASLALVGMSLVGLAFRRRNG